MKKLFCTLIFLFFFRYFKTCANNNEVRIEEHNFIVDEYLALYKSNYDSCHIYRVAVVTTHTITKHLKLRFHHHKPS